MGSRRSRILDPAGCVRTGEWTDDGIEVGDRVYDLEEIEVLPPVEPGRMIGVVGNYGANYGSDDEQPERPGFFFKPSNTFAGHRSVLTLPVSDERIVYEGEIGVVIGQEARNVPEDRAMDVVAGFTCVNDITDLGALLDRDDLARSKGFDYAGPVGPTVASPDLVPAQAALELRVNGERKQSASRSDMVFSVPELVASLTEFFTVRPGDVIATGTPPNLEELTDGDTVEISVEGVGTLEHGVRDGHL